MPETTAQTVQRNAASNSRIILTHDVSTEELRRRHAECVDRFPEAARTF